MANRGYYSIIQYIPDIGRMESVNVGVVLLVPALKYLEVEMDWGFEHAQRFFPDVNIPWLDAAKHSLVSRILQIPPEKAQIKRLTAKLANELRMTPLRSIKVTERPNIHLGNLRKELVDE